MVHQTLQVISQVFQMLNNNNNSSNNSNCKKDISFLQQDQTTYLDSRSKNTIVQLRKELYLVLNL